MNFTVALIARNEAKTVGRLLASLREFQARGGRILLLDTGSTDHTVEVARAAGCEVIEVGERFVRHIDARLARKINACFVEGDEGPIVRSGDRLFDFAAARNHVAALSPTDMIAMPDCDEAYTQLDLDAVTAHIAAGAEQFQYDFVFSHDAEGRPLVQFTHSKFYDRTKFRWVGIIHEVLQGDGAAVTLPASTLKLEHFQNRETDRSGYLKGLALDCYLHPDNDRNAHYFGRELCYAGKWRSAIKALTRHIAMNRWVTERAQSMNYLGECLIRLGQEDEGLQWYLRSVVLEPSRREPLIRLAEHFFHQKRPELTAIFAAAALQIGPSSYYANHAAHYGAYPHELLYWAKWHSGDRDASREHFLKALELDPTNPRILKDKRFYGLD